jgi:FkbM family methyltransferase
MQGLRQRPVVVGVGVLEGLTMNSGASNPEYALGTNEGPVQEAFRRLLPQGGVVFDVGANVGFFTLCAALLVGSHGYVYAFEPDLANATVARQNVSANSIGHVCICARAVGAQTGLVDLQVSRYSGGHAIVGATPPPDVVGSVPVEVVSLDDFVKAPGVRGPDFVKIDVEGAELSVLEGMVNVLATWQPTLLIELDDPSTEHHDGKVGRLRAWLSEHGYSSERLDDGYPQGEYVISHWVCRPS